MVRLSLYPLNSPIARMLTAEIDRLGINVKTLIPADGDAKTFTQWIESGVFDALTHKYVRNLSIVCARVLPSPRIPTDPKFSK